MMMTIPAATLLLGLAPGMASSTVPLPHPTDPRVVLITGSTAGLGREVARALAADGVHVILHGRNAEAGASLARELNDGPGSATFFRADLASLDEVRGLAEAVLDSTDRLDVVIANAGIWLDASDGRQVSADGHELHFQVNYLSHFLLTRLLLPRLRETAAAHGEARVIQVASIAQSPIDFDDVMLERDGAHARGYGQSKLAQILFAKDLAEEFAGTGLLSVSLHPATLMDTGMVLDRGLTPRASVDEGTEAVLHLVRASRLRGGAYFVGLTESAPNPQARDAEARARLRALSADLTGAP